MSGISAYYYSFDGTGVPEVDEILKAVAHAGHSFHSTDQWSDQQTWLDGKSFAELIQETANASAAEIDRLRAENAELSERCEKQANVIHTNHLLYHGQNLVIRNLESE